MNEPCDVALKEWAAICEALASGRQALLLRKGGLIERGDAFEVEHRRFWLYPTYLHQQEQGVAPADHRFLDLAHQNRPEPGQVRLSLLAEVVYATTLADETQALSLGDLHCWTPETIRARFHYRQPGLTVMALRVLKTAPHLITESTEQAGCRSWVPLEKTIAPEQGQLVLTDQELLAIVNRLG